MEINFTPDPIVWQILKTFSSMVLLKIFFWINFENLLLKKIPIKHKTISLTSSHSYNPSSITISLIIPSCSFALYLFLTLKIDRWFSKWLVFLFRLPTASNLFPTQNYKIFLSSHFHSSFIQCPPKTPISSSALPLLPIPSSPDPMPLLTQDHLLGSNLVISLKKTKTITITIALNPLKFPFKTLKTIA